MVKDGITPTATQSALMTAGKSITAAASVTVNNSEGKDFGISQLNDRMIIY